MPDDTVAELLGRLQALEGRLSVLEGAKDRQMTILLALQAEARAGRKLSDAKFGELTALVKVLIDDAELHIADKP